MNLLAWWLAGPRWHASALHLLEMWAFFLPGWAASGTPWGGTVAVWSWYWSRKRTETQAAAAPGALVTVPWVGLFPWQWTPALQLDFAMPAGASLLAAWLIQTI